MAANVVRPPEIIETFGPVLFFGGPIQGTWDWQAQAIDKTAAELADDVTIASPRNNDRRVDYDVQVDWETEYLNRAKRCGVVVFWLALQTELGAPDARGFYRAYAQTSRAELFEAKRDHEYKGANLVLGIEKGLGNERYYRRRFLQDCPDVPILDDLADTCAEAVRIINSIKRL